MKAILLALVFALFGWCRVAVAQPIPPGVPAVMTQFHFTISGDELHWVNLVYTEAAIGGGIGYHGGIFNSRGSTGLVMQLYESTEWTLQAVSGQGVYADFGVPFFDWSAGQLAYSSGDGASLFQPPMPEVGAMSAFFFSSLTLLSRRWRHGCS